MINVPRLEITFLSSIVILGESQLDPVGSIMSRIGDIEHLDGAFAATIESTCRTSAVSSGIPNPSCLLGRVRVESE